MSIDKAIGLLIGVAALIFLVLGIIYLVRLGPV